MMIGKGKFITLEGGEGAGKTTCLEHVERLIRGAGHILHVTREPGGTDIGEKIRALLLDPDHRHITPDTELLLMFAARMQHLEELIRPALAHGEWVLCDRFTDATYAYQGGGRGIAHARIGELEAFVQQGLRPDLTLLLDVPVEVGLQRAGERNTLDRFESESIAFQHRIRDAYLALAEAEPERFRIIDAGLPLPEVLTQVERALEDQLG